MAKTDFLLHLDELLELDPGTLSGSEKLESLASWDSLAVVGFIALADEQFGIEVSPERIRKCKTVDDLIGLFGEQVAA